MEQQELRKILESDCPSKKKEALKKILAQTEIGNDLSSLYFLIIQCKSRANTSLEMHRLIYLYIIKISKDHLEEFIMVHFALFLFLYFL